MPRKNKAKAKAVPSALLPSADPAIDPEDDDLMNDLLAQLDSRDDTANEKPVAALNQRIPGTKPEIPEEKPKQSAKDRFQARLARKAAALADHILPDDPEAQSRSEKEARDEENAIDRISKQHNRQVFQINPDGHCLYSAVADQLALLGKLPDSGVTYTVVRAAAADYIESHPDDFLPFLPNPEEGTGVATDSGLMSTQQFQQYCSSVRSTAVWGGEPEILALSRAFKVPIHVVQSGVPSVVVHNPSGGPGTVAQDGVWISYHRKLYGLGEHYNSLRPASMS